MKQFLQRILQDITKRNNTWNIRRLVASHLSHRPSEPAYYIIDWRIFGNPRSQHLMIDDLISIMRGSPFFVCMFFFEIRTVPETDPSSRFAQWKLLGKANSSSLVSHMSMTLPSPPSYILTSLGHGIICDKLMYKILAWCLKTTPRFFQADICIIP